MLQNEAPGPSRASQEILVAEKHLIWIKDISLVLNIASGIGVMGCGCQGVWI